MTESGDGGQTPVTGNSVESVPDRTTHSHEGHGPMGHSGAGHLLHMAPMVLILLAPRIGWPLTIVLLAMLGAYIYHSWRKRRRSRERAAETVSRPLDE